MLRLKGITGLLLALLLSGLATPGELAAQSPGDALELFSYRATPATRPNVYDGQIAAVTAPTDWRAAYVRQLFMTVDGGATDPRSLIFLASNDADTLYLSAAIQLGNASTLNRLTVYFDEGTRGSLQGSPTSPGEYSVSIVADGSAPQDLHWNGSSWVPNTVTAARGIGLRKGTSSAERLYNFELAIPLHKSADASNSYLGLTAGDKVGVLLRVTDNNGTEYYWNQTNATFANPSATGANGKTGWAEIVTSKAGLADRALASLFTNGIVPTIDGNVTNDRNWRYGFAKNLVLTDYNGNRLNASMVIKESRSPNNLLFGMKLNGVTPAPTDTLVLYFDQGGSGRSLNYVLTPGTHFDNAHRVAGNGTFQDYYFNGTAWVPDAAAGGAGAGSPVAGNWEVEMSIPLNNGDPQDLAVVSGDSLGLLLRYFDSAHGRNYWWSATVNNDQLVIDPVDPVYNALSWGLLYTGGPFIQPIYPQNGDTLSGQYPLAIYAIDPNSTNPKLGILSINYELRELDPAAGTYAVRASGALTRILDSALAVWTGTLNTRALSVPPGKELSLVFLVDNGKFGPIPVPLSVYVNNSMELILGDPSATISSPAPNSVLHGTGVPITFSATTNPLLTLDTVQVFVDGALLQTYLPQATPTYSNTYSWNTSSLPDGTHMIQVRAVNSLKLSNFSPTVLVTTANAPTITITGPAASSLLRATATVTFTAAPVGPATLANTQYSEDGGPWVDVSSPTPAAGGNGSHAWNTAPLTDGTHTIVLRTTDNLGKTGTSEPRSFVIDNTPPTGTLTTVPLAVKNGDTLRFVFSGSEAGLTAVIPPGELGKLDTRVTAGLALLDTAGSGVYTAVTVIHPDNAAPEGPKTLVANVTDPAGNVYRPTVTVDLDNTAPVFVRLISLDPNTVYANGETISLLATFDAPGYRVTADFSAIDVAYIRGSEIVTDNGDGTYSIRYTIGMVNSKPNGTYAVTATARDRVGLTATGSITLTLENTGPFVYDLTMADSDRVLNTNTTISARLVDQNSNITGAEYYVDLIGVAGEGIPVQAADGAFDTMTENITAVLNIAPLLDGKHTLYLRGLNVAGKWGPVAALDFIVDRRPPEIQNVEVVYPEGQTGASNGQNIIVKAMVTDKVTGVNPTTVRLSAVDADTTARDILMYDDGTHGDVAAGDDVYSVSITVNSGKTGKALTFTITAKDSVPNTRIMQGPFSLDNTPPQITIVVTPLPRNGTGMNGEVYADEVILSGGYFDLPDSSSIKGVTLTVKNPGGNNINDSPIGIPFTPDRRFSAQIKLVEGVNAISAVVTDLSGNIGRQDLQLTYIRPLSTTLVGKDGGTVTSPDGTSITIPPGALLTATEITIRKVSISQMAKPLNQNVRLLQSGHSIGPDGLVFHQPVTITLSYTNAELDINQDGINEIPEDRLDALFWDGSDWVRSAALSRSAAGRTVTIKTNHLSVYALGSDVSPATFDTYWTKNPFRPEDGTTAVINVPGPGFLTLKIYDLAGNLVRTIANRDEVTGTTNRSWNGLNDFDRYVGSGIYIYILTFEEGGGKSTVIKKPIGVVK